MSQGNLSKLIWYVISEIDSKFAVFDAASQTVEQTLIKNAGAISETVWDMLPSHYRSFQALRTL